MSRQFYSDYVRHALRYYTRSTLAQSAIPVFRGEADKRNWWACAEAIKCYAENEKNIFITVYSGGDTLADEVYKTSKTYNVNQNLIWDMMKEFERKIAKKRGLI